MYSNADNIIHHCGERNGGFSEMIAYPAASEELPTAMPVVSGLGLVVLDEVMMVAQSPTIDTKIFASEHFEQIGGPVPTALMQLRRFGLSARFLGSWADDAHGRAVETHLHHEGIDADRKACRTAHMTGFAHIWVESSTGRRTVVSLPPDGTPPEVAATTFGRESQVLHLDGWGGDAAVLAAQATHAAGGLVTLDTGSPKSATERLLPFVSVLNAPRRFITAFCGTEDVELGAKQLLAAGPHLVTITDGDHGAGVYTTEVTEWRPAFRVRAVDTCGAGDVFCGGLIYAVLNKMEPVEALRFAMATAAIKVSQRGNREALASRDEVDAFLKARTEPGASALGSIRRR